MADKKLGLDELERDKKLLDLDLLDVEAHGKKVTEEPPEDRLDKKVAEEPGDDDRSKK